MLILNNFFTNIAILKSIPLILIETMFSYWLTIKYSNLTILKNLCWSGNFSSNLLLFLCLGSRWLVFGYFPLSNLYESLLFLDWALLFILIIVESRTKTKIIGAIVIPIILFIVLFATLILPHAMQIASPLVPSLQSNWLMMHVSMMMVSYSILILGSLLSILFLVISKNNFSQVLKINKSKDNLLGNLDNWSYRTIGFGFPCLTIGIISGAVWANEAWGSYWSWDPKETWALITWIVFASYIHARLTKGWAGDKAAFLGSFGFCVVWICYLGTNFLGQGLHSYGFLN
jgi:cytochrome c-type biogenesis protein CcsB